MTNVTEKKTRANVSSTNAYRTKTTKNGTFNKMFVHNYQARNISQKCLSCKFVAGLSDYGEAQRLTCLTHFACLSYTKTETKH